MQFCWSLRNLFVPVYSKLHSKSCNYLYESGCVSEPGKGKVAIVCARLTPYLSCVWIVRELLFRSVSWNILIPALARKSQSCKINYRRRWRKNYLRNISPRIRFSKKIVMWFGKIDFNPLTAEWALRALIDFTLSNARRFYSSKGNPLDGKGLKSEIRAISQ